MKLEVSYNIECYESKVLPFLDLFNEIGQKVLELPEIKARLNDQTTYFLDVSFIQTQEIKKINKHYRHIDRVTDVISFAFWDEGLATPLLGEMFISPFKAIKQAKEYHHSYKREICFLFVHGLLHILGFDHMTVEDEKVMFGLQDVVLNSLGITR